MSVPGVGIEAADEIAADAVTNQKVREKIEDDADQLDEARDDKEINDNSDRDGSTSNDEADKLEAGEFVPHAMPRINWQETDDPNKDVKPRSRSNSIHDRTRMQSISDGDGTSQLQRPYGRGGAARRPSQTGPAITSEAAELARAEAASWAQMTPLMAATLGPLSVLLGIPTLTQRWHGYVLDPPVLPNGVSNFVELPDPPLNLVFAGVSLFCEVLGNGLLILRFSNFHTKITTWTSYAFWIAKIILGITNYILFGLAYPENGNIIYLQGFWVLDFCLLSLTTQVGVCSMAVSVIIIIFLTFNLAFLHQQSEDGFQRSITVSNISNSTSPLCST